VGETSENKEEAIYPEGYTPALDIPIPDPNATLEINYYISF